MVKKYQQQVGSVLAAGAIILVIVLISAVGVIAYQNFSNKNKQDDTTSTSRDDAQKDTLAATKEFRSKEHNITFTYPSAWTVVEGVSVESSPEWYSTSIKIKNEKSEIVAVLTTGGQFGGACDDDQPLVPVSTIVKDSLELKGVGAVQFGYTIVTLSNDNFGVAYGLASDTLTSGDASVRCPSMSVNYKYIFESKIAGVSGLTFGLWYGENSSADTASTYLHFSSLSEAKEYATSDEFKKIKSTITSLAIGN